MFEVDEVDLHLVPFAFDFPEVLEFGFPFSEVGYVSVLVDGVLGPLDFFVHFSDLSTFSGGFRSVRGSPGKSNKGRFDLAHVRGSVDDDIGVFLGEIESFFVFGLPAFDARLVLVLG